MPEMIKVEIPLEHLADQMRYLTGAEFTVMVLKSWSGRDVGRCYAWSMQQLGFRPKNGKPVGLSSKTIDYIEMKRFYNVCQEKIKKLPRSERLSEQKVTDMMIISQRMADLKRKLHA